MIFLFQHLTPKSVLDKKRKGKCTSGLFLPNKPSFCQLTCMHSKSLEAGRIVRDLLQKYKPKAGPVKEEKKGKR